MKKTAHTAYLAGMTVMVLSLAACGQRGPLYLPDNSESVAPPVEQAGEDPSSIEDDDDGAIGD